MTNLTTVVNIYHKLPYNTFIGRGSDWGNPFTHLEGTKALHKVETREEAVACFQKWIFTQRHLLARLRELKGKVLCCYCHPAPCHGHILAQLADTTWWKDDKLILECSSKGDIRFSAFGAEVEMFGKVATIEEHYQLSKVFTHKYGEFRPKSIYDVKGKNSKTKNMDMFCIEVNGQYFPPDYRKEFYLLMWLKYLDAHPDYVEYLSYFDDYNDIFKGKSAICQADAIRQYINDRDSVVEEVSDFSNMIGEAI